MNLRLITCLACMVLPCLTSNSSAQADALTIGDDTYLSEADALLDSVTPGDAFVAGFAATLNSDVAEDAHVAGFSVDIKADVAEDLYSAGATVEVRRSVGDDLNASGFTVRLMRTARVGGNARVAAGTLDIEAPIAGSLLATAGSMTLNAPVAGDVRLTVASLALDKDASIGGKLTYSAPAPIDIPNSVIPAARVRYVPLTRSAMLDDLYGNLESSLPDLQPTIVSKVAGLLVVLVFLLVVAAVCLAYAPNAIARLRQRTLEHAWFALLFGFIGLSVVLGAIPASVMVIIGIPLLPFLLLVILLLWTFGYLLGLHVVSLQIARAFGKTGHSLSGQLLLLAGGLVVGFLLNFVLIVGWIINLGIVLFGLGAITIKVMDELVARTKSSPRARLPSATATDEPG